MSILPQPLRQALKHVAQGLSNALPGSCLLCGEDSASRVICADCLAELPGMPPQCCPSCAEQTSYGERCGACLHKAPHFDKVIAGFRYDFPVDRIIHSLKYGHQLSVAEWFGERLSTQLTASDHDLIIPLPLHPARLLERGFNQSMEIARALGKVLDRRSSITTCNEREPPGHKPICRTRSAIKTWPVRSNAAKTTLGSAFCWLMT